MRVRTLLPGGLQVNASFPRTPALSEYFDFITFELIHQVRLLLPGWCLWLAIHAYNCDIGCPTNKAVSAPIPSDYYLTYKLIDRPDYFKCPPVDDENYRVEVVRKEAGNIIFCSYPTNFGVGEDPNGYYCRYSLTDGTLTEAHDVSGCPTTAVALTNVPDPVALCEGFCEAEGSKCKGVNLYLDNYSTKGTTTFGVADQFTCSLFGKKIVTPRWATNAGGQTNPTYNEKNTITQSKCFNIV